jgi:hypothetical protein
MEEKSCYIEESGVAANSNLHVAISGAYIRGLS